MNMMSRDLAGESQAALSSGETEATVRFATDAGATVIIAVDETGSKASREEVLVKAREAVKQLAAAFEEADAARRRKSDIRRTVEKDPGALFRSWAYR